MKRAMAFCGAMTFCPFCEGYELALWWAVPGSWDLVECTGCRAVRDYDTDDDGPPV